MAIVRITSLVASLATIMAGCGGPSELAEREIRASETGRPSAPADIGLSPFPDRVYWGDLHLHTSYSFDAHVLGNKQIGPDEAYRFAKGEPVFATGGEEARLSVPLDFLMVADHAEFQGIYIGLQREDPVLLGSTLGQRWAKYQRDGNLAGMFAEMGTMATGNREKEFAPDAFRKMIWSDLVETAERHYTPGKFTTFAGFEWTGGLNGGSHHRVVVFKDNPDKTLQTLPFSAVDSFDPIDLWLYLADYEEKIGGTALAIAHNGNLSNGNMFGYLQLHGEPFTEQYVNLRAKWEPLYEVTQMKGDGETHRLLSPVDEFADFETWDEANSQMQPKPSDEDQLRDFVRGEYAREALKTGLDLEDKFGVNPYQFGLVGSTDSHTSLSTGDEDNFWGKFTGSQPSENRILEQTTGTSWDNWRLTAGGYTGVWARANTREEIYAALERKEVYATTGPRIELRLFCGPDFEERDLDSSDIAAVGYEKGVPMGSVVEGRAARMACIASAAKDPNGANIDRLQIVKGWRDANGALQEQVYDVAASADRVPDAGTGRLATIGSTVNLETATYDNTIGAEALSTVWTDPDFDPSESAFYYARVIEIPTPRWTLYDKVRFDLQLPDTTPLTLQERAYGSPVWYKPDAS